MDSLTETVSEFEGDGLVTDLRGVALGALGADCAPVLFADPGAGVIGAAHGGWQGALVGVTDAVIDAMEAIGASRGSMVAAIGPAIQLGSYEVGEAFRSRFLEESPIDSEDCFHDSAETGNVHFDLPGYLVRRLTAAGVGRIDDLGLDTYADESRFFSYRRMCHRGESVYGRQIGAIALCQG